MNQRIMAALYLSAIASIVLFASTPICAKKFSKHTIENIRSSGCSSNCNHCHKPAPNGVVNLSMQNCISCNENKKEHHLCIETNYKKSLDHKQMCQEFKSFDAANYPQIVDPSKLVLVQNPAFNPPLQPGQQGANPPTVDPSQAISVVGKKVLIIGGAKNIGKAVSEKFFAEGANVTATSRNPKCYKKPPYTLKKLDVRHGDDVKRFIKKYIRKNGRIDILILMPAINWDGPLADGIGSDILNYFNATIVGMQRVVHYALPYMRHSDETRVITFGSLQAYDTLPLWNALYAITKRALQSWNDFLQTEEMYSKAQGLTQFGPTFSLLEPTFITSTLGLYEADRPSSLNNHDPETLVGLIAVAPDQSLGGGFFTALTGDAPYTVQQAAQLTFQVAIAPQPGVRYWISGDGISSLVTSLYLADPNDRVNALNDLATGLYSTANLTSAKAALLADLCS